MSTAFISHSTSTTRKSILLLVIVATIAVSFSSIFAIRAEAAADTCTWTGGTSNDMNDANNWTGCDGFGIPESGDSYVFPQSASNKALSIDSVSVNPASMRFTGTGYSLNRTGSQVLDFIVSGVAIEVNQNVDVSIPMVIVDET